MGNGAALVSNPEGLDISHYQPFANWQQIRRAERVFAYIKCTEGTDYIDSFFSRNWEGARGAGVIRGAYHFLSHDLPAQEQANHFAHTFAGHSVGGGVLPIAVDVEPDPSSTHALRNRSGGAYGTSWPADHMVRLLDDFQTYCKVAFGQYAVIYTYPDWWIHYMGNTHNYKDAVPLWIAAYPTVKLPLPGGWQSYMIHQYTSNGHIAGVNGAADLDRYNGSLADLQTLAGLGV